MARILLDTFATCFYAILEPKSATLSYANAGHDLPYPWHGNGQTEELRARDMPLGLMPKMSYEEGEASLREEDGVLFYSDGLVEGHGPNNVRCSVSRDCVHSSPSAVLRRRRGR